MLCSLKSALREFDYYHVFEPWWRKNSSSVIVEGIYNEDFWQWENQLTGLTKSEYDREYANDPEWEDLLPNGYRHYYYERKWGNAVEPEWIPIRQSLYRRIDKLMGQVKKKMKIE